MYFLSVQVHFTQLVAAYFLQKYSKTVTQHTEFMTTIESARTENLVSFILRTLLMLSLIEQKLKLTK